MNAKSDVIYAMVKDFRSRGVTIDGVGLEMHIFDRQPDLAESRRTLPASLPLGLRYTSRRWTWRCRQTRKEQQAIQKIWRSKPEVYRGVARICVNHPGCTAIQTWGFTDKYSWIRSTTKGTKGVALLFDRDYRPKPKYFGLQSALSEVRGLPRSAAK